MESHITFQRQQTTIVAVHRRQAIVERQVGSQDLLAFGGHDKVIDRFRRQLVGKENLDVRQVAGVIEDTGQAEESRRRRLSTKAGVGQQMSGGRSQRGKRLRGGQAIVSQTPTGDEQLDQEKPGQRELPAPSTGARCLSCAMPRTKPVLSPSTPPLVPCVLGPCT